MINGMKYCVPQSFEGRFWLRCAAIQNRFYEAMKGQPRRTCGPWSGEQRRSDLFGCLQCNKWYTMWWLQWKGIFWLCLVYKRECAIQARYSGSSSISPESWLNPNRMNSIVSRRQNLSQIVILNRAHLYFEKKQVTPPALSPYSLKRLWNQYSRICFTIFVSYYMYRINERFGFSVKTNGLELSNSHL